MSIGRKMEPQMGARAWFLAMIALLLAAGCAREKDPVLATVENFAIRYSDVVNELRDHGRLRKGEEPSRAQVERTLERLVERKLKYLEGLRRGYDKSPDIAPYIEAFRKDMAYRLYRDDHVIKKLISDKDVWEFYRKYADRVKVRHILLRVPEDATQDMVEEARDKIEDIRTLILAGASFAEMARKYSDEAQTASRGGDWGYIRWGTGRFDSVFYEVAFSLKPGELSKPFRTRLGWHLLLCEGRRKPSREDFEFRKEKMRTELMRQRASEIDSAMYALRDRLFRQYNVRLNEEGVKLLHGRIQEIATDTTVKAPQLRRITRTRQFERVRPEDRPVVLCSWDGGRITVGDLVDEIERLKEYRRPVLDTEQKIRDWLERMASLRVITAEAFRLGYHKRPEVVAEIQRRLEVMVASKFDREEIYGPAIPKSEEELRAFYEADPSRFREPEKAKVQEIFIRHDHSLAEKVAKMAKSGADFEELARKYNQRTVTKGKNGWLGYISADMYANVGKKALTMRPGEIAGPIPMGNNFSIIRVVDRKPSYIPSFEEARSKVRKEYIRTKREELRQRWMTELRKKYRVVLHKERIASVLKEQESEEAAE